MDLLDLDTFVIRDSRNVEKENLVVDYQTLNDNQKIVFKRLETHYQNVLVEYQNNPLKILIMGTAGTSTTYLIEAIRNRLRKWQELN